mgnify:CR=1 FL=1
MEKEWIRWYLHIQLQHLLLIKDKNNKKRLEYVNISIPGSTSGTITNEDGEFSFKIKDASHVKAVEISHIGYYNNKVEVSGKNLSDLTVWMTPYENMLDEIIIHAKEPRYLVEEAIKKIPGVNDASVSFMTQKMTVETADDAAFDDIMKQVVSVCAKVEPDCKILL